MNRDVAIQYDISVWVYICRNWITSGHLRVEQINFEHMTGRKILKHRHGDKNVWCVVDRSPRVIRRITDAITSLYQYAETDPPEFVSYRQLKRMGLVA